MSQNPRYTLHNDQWAKSCQLGREPLIEELAGVALTAQPPLVLGVHGDWGSGKTSFMRHVNATLDKNHRKEVVTVWFDAWRYQNEPVPVVALLQEMRRRYSAWPKAKASTRKIGEVTLRALLSSWDDITGRIGLESLPVSGDKIQEIGEAFEKIHFAESLQADDLRQHLQDAITELLKAKGLKRLVVFIDDLDRCHSGMAFRLLEGLKIYLGLDNCIFILAMNQQQIIEAISERLAKDDGDSGVKLRAEAYLEKLCANIWRLPPPARAHEFFLAHLDGGAATTPKDVIGEVAARARHPFLPPNPRRLKALANLYNRLWQRASFPNSAGVEPELLALRVLVVAYIYQFHSELYQRWRHDPIFFEELKEWLRSGSERYEGKEFGQDLKRCFAGLILPTRVVTDAGAATPGQGIRGNFPDPASTGVFWIAPLLQEWPLAGDHPDDYRELTRLEQS